MELLVATLIASVVILIAGYGFIVAMNGERVAQAASARRSELNRAFDFMTNEIRMAQSINQTTNPISAPNTPITDVINQAGLSGQLGTVGNVALYLEIPTTNPSAACPVEYDKIVYDIRSSTGGWLPPYAIHRYGRTPRANGTIDPCSLPVSSDVLVDAIADHLDTAPVCNAPGSLMGSHGFQACVDGAQVDVYLQSSIAAAGMRKIESAASSRLVNLSQAFSSPLQLSGNRPLNSDDVSLTWTYSGTPSPTSYELFHTWNGSTTTSYSGSNTSFVITLSASQPGEHRFWIEAKSNTQMLGKSNEVVFTK